MASWISHPDTAAFRGAAGQCPRGALRRSRFELRREVASRSGFLVDEPTSLFPKILFELVALAGTNLNRGCVSPRCVPDFVAYSSITSDRPCVSTGSTI